MIYTGAQLTIRGILDEVVVVAFNNHDGQIGLSFEGAGEKVDTQLSYPAARQLIGALSVALEMKRTNKEKVE